jgi:hypothetical protein
MTVSRTGGIGDPAVKVRLTKSTLKPAAALALRSPRPSPSLQNPGRERLSARLAAATRLFNIDHARKLCQQAVAGVLNDPAPMLVDLRIDQLPKVGLEPLVGALLIGRLTAILAADVAGYSRLMGAPRSAARDRNHFPGVLRLRPNRISPVVSKNSGSSKSLKKRGARPDLRRNSAGGPFQGSVPAFSASTNPSFA